MTQFRIAKEGNKVFVEVKSFLFFWMKIADVIDCFGNTAYNFKTVERASQWIDGQKNKKIVEPVYYDEQGNKI